MKKKILASIMAVATMATCVFSAVACNKETPKDEVASSVQEEMKDSGTFEVEDVTPTPGMRLNVVKTPTYNTDGTMGVTEDSYELTATVYPEDAADKTVTYTIAWSNPNSSWAKNKVVTDYVTIAQASAGSLKATVTCKKAFSEPIIATVTSNDNSAAKASATLHYKKKILSYMVEQEFGYMEQGKIYTNYGSGTNKQDIKMYVDFSNTEVSGEVFEGYVDLSIGTRNNQDYDQMMMFIKPTEEFAAVLLSLGAPTDTIHSNENLQISMDLLLNCNWFEEYGTTNVKRNQIINALMSFKGVAYNIVFGNGATEFASFNVSLDTSALSSQKRVESVGLQNTEIEF